jgi:hypothetical protein
MCRIMVIRSPCVGMTRPAACPVVGLSALGRRRRPRWEGADLGGVAGVAQCGERPGLGERADRERGADLAQGGDDARIGDEVATRSPARPWILEKVRSTATRPEATSGRQVVASGSSVNST